MKKISLWALVFGALGYFCFALGCVFSCVFPKTEDEEG